jgi:uncharacterized protein GlcG (DUF336 family)
MAKKALSLGVAKKLAASAEEEVVKNKWTVVIAIVDDGETSSTVNDWMTRRSVASRWRSRRPRAR